MPVDPYGFPGGGGGYSSSPSPYSYPSDDAQTQQLLAQLRQLLSENQNDWQQYSPKSAGNNQSAYKAGGVLKKLIGGGGNSAAAGGGFSGMA